MQHIIKLISILFLSSILFSCGKKINQDSMFKDRSHVSKKRGIYDVGMKRGEVYKTPPSVQSRNGNGKSDIETNPKKAAKERDKALKKKQLKSHKARKRYNKKRRIKVKTTKGKTGGDKEL